MAVREQVRAEVAAIKRHATVVAIKKQALGLAPVCGRGIASRSLLYPQKRPRALFVFPPKYARVLQACRCLRVR
jgi:hypothetical protein